MSKCESQSLKTERFYISALILVILLAAFAATYGVLAAASSDSDSSVSSTFNTENHVPEDISLKADTVKLSGTANVLLILLDDAGWGDFSHHTDDPWYSLYTPTMDSIMSEGLYFTNYYTQSVCTPARSSLMTGRWTWVLGTQDNILYSTCMKGHLNKNFPTYAELTSEKNYKNYLYGKWHLGMDSWSSTPLGRGFHEFLGNLNSGGVAGGGGSVEEKGGWYSVFNPVWDCNTEQADRVIKTLTYTECLMRSWIYYFADWHKGTGLCYTWLKSSIPEVCHNYTEGIELSISDSTLYPDGWYVHLSIYQQSIDFWKNMEAANPLIGKRHDMNIFDKVETQLEELSKTPGKRWSMMLSLKTPHQDSAYLENGTHTNIVTECSRYFDTASEYYNYDRGAICQKMHEVDERIGDLIWLLKRLGTWNETLVILTNDNGGTSGQNPTLSGGATEYNYAINWPLRGVKTSYYQGAVKTILAISGGALPTALRGTNNNDLHHVSDIAPTIAAVAGFSDEDFEDISDGTNFDGFSLLATTTASYGQHKHVYLSMPSYTADYTSNNSVLVLSNGMKYIGPGGNLQAFGYWGTLPVTDTRESKYELCTEGCVWDLTTDPFEETDIGGIVDQTEFDSLLDAALTSELWQDGVAFDMASCSVCSCCQSCTNDNTTIEVKGFRYYFPWLDN